MHPEFIRLGPLDIHTYGVFVAIGFIVGLAVAARRARREGIDPERITDLGVWLIIAGMLGGKLFHIIFFWNDFISGWREEGMRSLREGFVFYGGFIVASLAAVAYATVKKLPFSNGGYLCAVDRAGTRLWPHGLFLQRVLLRQAVLAAVGGDISAAAHHGRHPRAPDGNLRGARQPRDFLRTERDLPPQTLRRPDLVAVRAELRHPAVRRGVLPGRLRHVLLRRFDLWTLGGDDHDRWWPRSGWSSCRDGQIARARGLTMPLHTVSAATQGLRLDQFLQRELPEHSRAFLQKLIEQGDVRVNGKPSKPSYTVRAGDRVRWKSRRRVRSKRSPRKSRSTFCSRTTT